MVAKKNASPILSNSPNRFSLSFTGSLSSAKHSFVPLSRRASSSSARESPAVTSTLVTGSAATTSHATFVGAAAAAARTRFLEKLRIGEEQRRVPSKQQQARQLTRVGDSGRCR